MPTRPGWDFPTHEEMQEFFGKFNPFEPFQRDIDRITKALGSAAPTALLPRWTEIMHRIPNVQTRKGYQA